MQRHIHIFTGNRQPLGDCQQHTEVAIAISVLFLTLVVDDVCQKTPGGSSWKKNRCFALSRVNRKRTADFMITGQFEDEV